MLTAYSGGRAGTEVVTITIQRDALTGTVHFSVLLSPLARMTLLCSLDLYNDTPGQVLVVGEVAVTLTV